MRLLTNFQPTSKQVISLTIISAIMAGILYFIRTNYLSLNPVQNNLFRAVRMTMVYVLLPFGWAIVIKKFNLHDLGITKNNIITSTILGLGVYSIALVAFLFSLGDPDFDRHFSWGADYSIIDWLTIMALVSWMAFVTDLWTRGFILILLAKFQSYWFAVLVQNITWLGVHVYEVALLAPAMGVLGALGLTISIGLIGDIIALKTKNIIGLGIGHIYLNIVFFGYVRFIM